MIDRNVREITVIGEVSNKVHVGRTASISAIMKPRVFDNPEGAACPSRQSYSVMEAPKLAMVYR